MGLLAALAGGAGGEMGRQAWSGLSELVRRPFGHGPATVDDAEAPAVSSGEAELTALERAPADQARGQSLSTALAVRAALDPDFRTGLQQWCERAKLVRTGSGDVHNTISGGRQYGTVIMGRDISGLTLDPGAPPQGRRAADEDAPPEA
ncbi:hypothetical protein ACIQBJ_16160 [Kitasatospora sp. NPDC088391]|uniref:hypothetical protein n=1 Tax=Kitasatospora sp. NPDC088391 TaxID=3364074 RepID=UPI00382979FF